MKEPYSRLHKEFILSVSRLMCEVTEVGYKDDDVVECVKELTWIASYEDSYLTMSCVENKISSLVRNIVRGCTEVIDAKSSVLSDIMWYSVIARACEMHIAFHEFYNSVTEEN